jgi:hypothetical protein
MCLSGDNFYVIVVNVYLALCIIDLKTLNSVIFFVTCVINVRRFSTTLFSLVFIYFYYIYAWASPSIILAAYFHTVSFLPPNFYLNIFNKNICSYIKWKNFHQFNVSIFTLNTKIAWKEFSHDIYRS